MRPCLPWLAKALIVWSAISCPVSALADPVASVPNVVTMVSPMPIRSGVPASFFGFNIEWLPFQMGYLRNGLPRREIVDWLEPFHGAMYRYPGGDKANWFNWRQSIGTTASRGLQVTENEQADSTQFGIEEFLDFVREVNGVPLLVANLFGERQRPWTEGDLASLNRGLVAYVNSRPGMPPADPSDPFRPCDVASPCRVTWWELGNELDWKGHRWPVGQIVSRAKAVASEMRLEDSSIRFVAFSRTGGFLPEGNEDIGAGQFNRQVSRAFGDVASAFSTHIYYEGRTVPEVLGYLQQLSSDLDDGRTESQRIFVTEHARWPNMPERGPWQATWSRTGDIGGAIATADFLLGALAIPVVDVALWHQLGARGPWQLFYRSEHDDHLWPSVVYWGLRVLRLGTLDDVLETQTTSDNRVWPGYAIRALFTRKADKSQYSLMAVNRSGRAQSTRLRVADWAGRSLAASHNYITGSSREDANAEGEENRVTMQQQAVTVNFDGRGEAMISLPPFSVSAFLFDLGAPAADPGAASQ